MACAVHRAHRMQAQLFRRRSSLYLSLTCLAACHGASAPATLPELREPLAQLTAGARAKTPVGSSFLAGVQSRVLVGDPAAPGFYSILLFVPPHTTIAAHSHRDNRLATVLSGTWHFGYGDRFAADALAALPPGSVYTEPAGRTHFAQTDDEPVIVQLTGAGPTDTVYVDPAAAPAR